MVTIALRIMVPNIIDAYRIALFLFLLTITSSGVKNFDMISFSFVVRKKLALKLCASHLILLSDTEKKF